MCLCAFAMCVFSSLSMRYHAEVIVDVSRKEFKRKNSMMIERYKTETLFQKVLPPEITEQMRSMSSPGPNIQLNIPINAPIHDKHATVAFVKISLFNDRGEEIDDNNDPEIVVNSLHQIVCKFDKIIFLHSGVQKVEHVANTYLLCSGLLHENMADTVHPQLMLHACIALQDICSTLRLKEGRFVQITVGIHSGKVLGTVVGAQRRFFRIFGDTVNTASRICSTGIKHKINVSAGVHAACTVIESLSWEHRENIPMKGKGTMTCMVLQEQSRNRRRSLDAKFKDARALYDDAVSHKSKKRNSKPRWMVQGSLLVKQNTKQSSNVYVNRLQEVTQGIHHSRFTLRFKNDRALLNGSKKYGGSEGDQGSADVDVEHEANRLHAQESMFHRSAEDLETRFRNERFQKRKRSPNWYLYLLYTFSVVLLAVHIGYALYKKAKLTVLIIPLTAFCLSSLSYVCYSVFLSYQMRRGAETSECLILAISALTSLHSTAYCELDALYTLNVLLFVVLCVAFSKASHEHSLCVCCLICIAHVVLFWSQLYRVSAMAVYAAVLIGAFLLSTWFSYHSEYKLRELFIVNLAFQKEQISITKELSTLLPGFVIERMIGSGHDKKQQIVDKFNHATIFQSDLVGFTKYSSTRTPAQVVAFLNKLYMKLDALCMDHGLEKVDTIGDAYICITFTGSPDPVLQFALKLIDTAEIFVDENVGLRIGIATGKVIGTVLGECTKRYAVFGAALNRAITLEGGSENKRILCCKQTVKRASKSYKFQPHSDEPTNSSFWLSQRASFPHSANES